MKFYSKKPDQIVHGIGKFENGVLETDNPEEIETLKQHYEYEEQKVDDSYVIEELHDIARGLEITGFSRMKKKELIKEINKAGD